MAVVDDGVDGKHPDLQGAVVGGFNGFTGEADGAAVVNHDCDPTTNSACDTGTHGTLVAGVIAARANGRGAHGVAPEAGIFAINADTRANDGLFGRQDVENAAAWNAAMAAGATIFNHSYGVEYDPEFESIFSSKNERGYRLLRPTIDDGAVHVFATGNSSAASPTMEVMRVVYHPELEGGVIGVTAAVKSASGRIVLASYANACGEAKNSCLAAPTGDFGDDQRFVALVASDESADYHRPSDPDQDGYRDSLGGTSAAAPFVAGALALLQQAFPDLAGRELGAILLGTAQDIGAPGVDDVFGHGLVDVVNALRAQGVPVIAQGETLDTAIKTPVSASTARVAGALRGRLAALGANAVFFDSYNRAYPLHLDGLVDRPEPFENPLDRLSTMLAAAASEEPERGPVGFALAMDGAASRLADLAGGPDGAGGRAFRGGFLDFAESEAAGMLSRALGDDLALSFSVGAGLGEGWAPQSARAAVDLLRTLDQDTTLGLRAGFLNESGSFLGSGGEGALDIAESANTVFLEAILSRRLSPRLRLIGQLRAGRSVLEEGGGLIRFDGPVDSYSAMAGVSVNHFLKSGDRFDLVGGVPLHAARGTATLTYATGRNADRTIRTTTERLSLGGAPPLALRMDYHAPAADWLSLGLTAGLRHDEGADLAGDVGIGGKVPF